MNSVNDAVNFPVQTGQPSPVAGVIGTNSAPPLDAARYWSYLENLEASDTQKMALLEALWSIIAGFVQIGFGADPVQAVIPALIDAALRDDDPNMIGLTASQFNASAENKTNEED